MTIKTRTEVISDIKLDLADIVDASIWDESVLDRCIEMAIYDLSRFIPRQQAADFYTDFDVTQGWTSAASAGTYVALTYKPIEKTGVTVKNLAGTTCTEGTDFLFDYINGQITHISGGLIGNTESCTISYTKSKITIDLSTKISDLIRVASVEYPYGNTPQTELSYSLWNNLLTVTSSELTQSKLADSKHIIVTYESLHTLPTNEDRSSIPIYLDTVFELLAGAYALFIKSQEAKNLAKTTMDDAVTSVGTITTILATAGVALGAGSTAMAAGTTALSGIAALRTAVTTALDAAKAELLGVDAIVTSATTASAAGTTALSGIAALLGAITTALDAANAELDSVDALLVLAAKTFIDGANVSGTVAAGLAQALLNTGDDFIPTVNVAANVPENYRNYADEELVLAKIYEGGFTNYLNDVSRKVDTAVGYANEANQRIANVNALISQANVNATISDSYSTAAGKRTDAAIGYVNEANQRISNIGSLISEATTNREIGDGYVAIGTQYIQECNAYAVKAEQLKDSARAYLDISVRYKEDAVERRTEAWNIFADPSQYIPQITTSSKVQISK
jgi:hypothetical protein